MADLETILASGNITEIDAQALKENGLTIIGLIKALSSRFHGFQENNVVETDFSSTTPGDFITMAIILTPHASNADFTVSNGIVTYTGISAKRFIMSTMVSGHKVGPGTANIVLKAYKNGSTPLSGKCVQQFLTGDPAGIGVTSEPVDLVTNDTLEVKMANNTDQDNVLAGNTIILISEWF